MIGDHVPRRALTAEGGSRWVKAHHERERASYLFSFLLVAWRSSSGSRCIVPHEGAGSPYGAIGLIALFSGFFICSASSGR